MTRNKNSFASYTPLDTPINIWTADKTIKAVGKGDVRVRVFNGNEWLETVLHDVHYVPDLRCMNLFSEGTSNGSFWVSCEENC